MSLNASTDLQAFGVEGILPSGVIVPVTLPIFENKQEWADMSVITGSATWTDGPNALQTNSVKLCTLAKLPQTRFCHIYAGFALSQIRQFTAQYRIVFSYREQSIFEIRCFRNDSGFIGIASPFADGSGWNPESYGAQSQFNNSFLQSVISFNGDQPPKSFVFQDGAYGVVYTGASTDGENALAGVLLTEMLPYELEAICDKIELWVDRMNVFHNTASVTPLLPATVRGILAFKASNFPLA